jgi:hypothetical protein
MLISLAMTPTTYAADSASLSTHASFNLATYREMKKSDQDALGLILTAMRETVLGAGQNGREGMGNVYIEARPKGRPEGGHIDDYVAEDHADHVLATFKTQREAIEWAQKHGHSPLVARVRHLNDKKKPDHWRAA